MDEVKQMKNTTLSILAASLIVLQPATTFAANIQVEWTQPSNYTDIKAGQEQRDRFQARTFKSFEKHLQKLASTLPQDQKLTFNFTNIDLAGDVNLGNLQRIRVIKETYFPRLSFSYQYLDSNNSVIKTEQVSLKNPRFLVNSRFKYRNKFLSYEKDMLDNWFKDTFVSKE